MPGRSPAVATRGMAATSHPLATVAALDALRRGGNAADAAIAAVAVLCVVEPQSTGIGGDCFWMYAPPGAGRPLAYNGSGRAPRGIPDLDEIGPGSPHAVTVPGAIDAWARLNEEHGSMDLGALLADAIRHAGDGFAVQAAVAADWALAAATLRGDPDAAAAYLVGGAAPSAGERVRFPMLAATLRAIAEGGRSAFYEGDVARDIARKAQILGGALSEEDLAAHEGEPVEPIELDYRGATIYECPPPGQGVIALEMLSVLAGFDLAGLEPASAIRLHLECEAGRLCFADRDALLGDAEVPVAALLSPAHASALRARIDPDAAMTDVPSLASGATHRDTVYLATADAEGGTCSFINSLFHPFGSGILAPGSGVLLQNRGSGFSTTAGHPNRVGPGKRPMHTIIPGMALEPEGSMLAFGVMGGDYQPFGHAHVIGNLRDHGLDLQQALDVPRVFHTHGVLLAEGALPREATTGLASRGHRVIPAAGGLGGGQAVRVDRSTGVLTGASDHRKDGFAAGI